MKNAFRKTFGHDEGGLSPEWLTSSYKKKKKKTGLNILTVYSQCMRLTKESKMCNLCKLWPLFGHFCSHNCLSNTVSTTLTHIRNANSLLVKPQKCQRHTHTVFSKKLWGNSVPPFQLLVSSNCWPVLYWASNLTRCWPFALSKLLFCIYSVQTANSMDEPLLCQNTTDNLANNQFWTVSSGTLLLAGSLF